MTSTLRLINSATSPAHRRLGVIVGVDIAERDNAQSASKPGPSRMISMASSVISGWSTYLRKWGGG